jgi:hypothetical protein
MLLFTQREQIGLSPEHFALPRRHALHERYVLLRFVPALVSSKVSSTFTGSDMRGVPYPGQSSSSRSQFLHAGRVSSHFTYSRISKLSIQGRRMHMQQYLASSTCCAACNNRSAICRFCPKRQLNSPERVLLFLFISTQYMYYRSVLRDI